MPVEMHSSTLRMASPGLSGPAALLITFSTSSSIAWRDKHTARSRHTEIEEETPDSGICFYVKEEVKRTTSLQR